jgi:hypothetical protein
MSTDGEQDESEREKRRSVVVKREQGSLSFEKVLRDKVSAI